MNRFIKIKIEVATAEELEILIAELSEMQFYAFDEEDHFLNAYIKEEDFEEEKFLIIIGEAKNFAKSFIEEENWNADWESSFQPVVINDFVSVRANFHEPVTSVKYDLVITPKMSFGTGHHATTFLVISQMQDMDFAKKSVLDFGTGTGLLAILAKKLGASNVLAIDCDEWSINNSIENFEANAVRNMTIERRDSIGFVEPMDIVLANINFNVLNASKIEITKALKSGGSLLISGFYENDARSLENIFQNCGFVKVKSTVKDNWCSILFKKV
ncbi:MAG: 50S ribosomal protein L11 methyltransferase [Ginsengibacter sp.]